MLWSCNLNTSYVVINNHDGDDVDTHIGKVFANDKIWQLAR